MLAEGGERLFFSARFEAEPSRDDNPLPLIESVEELTKRSQDFRGLSFTHHRGRLFASTIEKRIVSGAEPQAVLLILADRSPQIAMDNTRCICAEAKTSLEVKIVYRPQKRHNTFTEKIVEHAMRRAILFNNRDDQANTRTHDVITNSLCLHDQIFHFLELTL